MPDGAQFGDPLFGEEEFGEVPEATLIQARSQVQIAVTSSLVKATPERRYS